MKIIALFCLTMLSTAHAEKGARPANIVIWNAGQTIDWFKIARDWTITSARLRHPSGRETPAPATYLEVVIKPPNEKPRHYRIDANFALTRGVSLNELRQRLMSFGYQSIVALQMDDQGHLVDWILQYDCDLQLERADQEAAERRAP